MKIRWTKKADRSYQKILAYTVRNFGDTVANSFIQRTFKLLDIIKENPLAYKVNEGSKHCNQALIVKSISMYYSIKKDEIIIIAIWQNNRDPKSLVL
jgi:plasmid stabilization system protein ParE